MRLTYKRVGPDFDIVKRTTETTHKLSRGTDLIPKLGTRNLKLFLRFVKKMKKSWFDMRLATLCLLLLTLAAPLVAQEKRPVAIAPQPVPIARPLTVSDQAALVTEFEVNGLKVLVKRREGSQTVVAGLFIKGGTRNITACNVSTSYSAISPA